MVGGGSGKREDRETDYLYTRGFSDEPALIPRTSRPLFGQEVLAAESFPRDCVAITVAWDGAGFQTDR